MTSGVLPAQALRRLITEGAIAGSPAIRDDQIQPASLDLRLGPIAYRVRASFLAGHGQRVQDRLEEFTMHRVNLAEGAVLEKNCVYVIPLAESLALPEGTTAVANAKSSSGRLDLLTRTITAEAPKLHAENIAACEDGYRSAATQLAPAAAGATA